MNKKVGYDLLTRGLREKLKKELPFSAEYIEIHIFSSKQNDGANGWSLEYGARAESAQDCYLCEKMTGLIADSRKGQWHWPKYLLWKIYMLDELKRRLDESNLIPLKGFLDLVLGKIIKRFDNCKMFESLLNEEQYVVDYLLAEINQSDSLLDQYIGKVLKEKGLPERGIIMQLSGQMYEKRPIHGRIYFVAPQVWEQNYVRLQPKILDLREIEPEQRQLKMESMRGIRKFLEMTDERTCLVFTIEQKPTLMAMLKIHDIVEMTGSWIEFSGHFMWKLFLEGSFWAGYKNGSPYLKIEEDVKGACGPRIDKLGLEDENTILQIIEFLKNEKHGTSIVFMDKKVAIKEVIKFHEKNRCIKLNENGINLLAFLNEMPGITAIDGALLADLQGNCYAVGVILDGEAVKPGKAERGARYNSVSNYVYIKNKEYENITVFGVVVSEDQSVDVEIPE